MQLRTRHKLDIVVFLDYSEVFFGDTPRMPAQATDGAASGRSECPYSVDNLIRGAESTQHDRCSNPKNERCGTFTHSMEFPS